MINYSTITNLPIVYQKNLGLKIDMSNTNINPYAPLTVTYRILIRQVPNVPRRVSLFVSS